MSLEYPDCNNYDCYYNGNEDRVNGSDESIKVVHNRDVNNFDFALDISCCSGPVHLTFCDVCYYNLDYKIFGKCYLCELQMLDPWITLEKWNFGM